MNGPIQVNPRLDSLTGDRAVKNAVVAIRTNCLSVGELRQRLSELRTVFGDRPPAVIAPIAHKLLAEAMNLESLRSEFVQQILEVIAERGLWVEPDPEIAKLLGGSVQGVEPAESFDEFVEKNRISDRLADRPAAAARAEATELQPTPVGTGVPGPGRGNKTSYNYNRFSEGERGSGADYLRARLARDFPGHLERWKNGEFRSVRAACIDAGIVSASAQLVLTRDPFTSAQRIHEQRSQDWIDDLIRALSPGGVLADDRPGDVRCYLEALPPDRLRYVLSTLCTTRPEVLSQLLEDMADDYQPDLADEPAATAMPESPAPVAAPAAPAPAPAPKASSNGHRKAVMAPKPAPAPGFYGATALAGALGSEPRTVTAACNRAACDGEILKRLLADAPFKVLLHRDNPRERRYEVVYR
jgi:hypothetical protein